jgi:hypothetical protein
MASQLNLASPRVSEVWPGHLRQRASRLSDPLSRMAASGQTQPLNNVRSESALLSTPVTSPRRRSRREGPIAAVLKSGRPRWQHSPANLAGGHYFAV